MPIPSPWLIVASVFLVSGCSVTGSKFPDKPLAKYQELRSTVGPEAMIALDTDMSEALRYCRSVLNYYERAATQSSRALAAIAITGAIAGGVVVPALSAKAVISKSAVAGWGGISGVANAAQSSITGQNLGPDSFLATRGKISAGIESVMTEYYKETDAGKRADLVLKMYSRCIANDITAAQPGS